MRRIAVAFACVVLAAAAAALPARAQVLPCDATVNGARASEASHWTRPLIIRAGEPVTIGAFSRAPTSFAQIGIVVAGARIPVHDVPVDPPGFGWSSTLVTDEHQHYATGLYEVSVRTDSCAEQRFWVRVEGRGVLSTVAGQAGLAVLLGGLLLLVSALVRARVRPAGVRGAAAGVLAGAGGLTLTQQAGVLPAGADWIALWTAAPGAATWLTQRLVASRAASARVVRLEAPVEPPAAATLPPAAAEPDPPRSAYARLDAPEVVVHREPFEIAAGLAEHPDEGVAGLRIVRPESSVGPYTLAVQIVADGFDAPDGSWRHELRVTAADPYPAFTMRLVAREQSQPVRARAIQAIFSVDGQTLGLASRSVAIVTSAESASTIAREPQDSATGLAIPASPVAPDLSIRILWAESESDGTLLWSFETPHPIAVPDRALVTDIGEDVEVFARHLVQKIADREGRPGLAEFLLGVGHTVADQMPPELWPVLDGVARAAGGSPSVLLISQEPHVPWELAVLDPPLDPGAPPFLGTQADVGRWVLGRRRPPLPPPERLGVRTVAVVAGEYDESWRLAEAEEEARILSERFGAPVLDAETAAILQCLGGSPPADVLHFATHGVYQPDEPKNGLVLVDGSTLDPLEIRGARVDGRPFVFLNACQVGSGSQILGDYAGMAEAFLYAGASGVIAPLWSVGDRIAKDIALRFYERALDGNEPPARVLRDERRRFAETGSVSATYLAYQFFGHPRMRLARAALDSPTRAGVDDGSVPV